MARQPSKTTIGILEILLDSSRTMADLHDYMLSGGFMYGFGGSKEKARAFYQRSKERRKDTNEAIDAIKIRQKIHNALHRLKKDGFISAEKKGGNSIFKTTKQGIEKIREWKNTRMKSETPKIKTPKARFEKEKASSPIIVSFDIPEREKMKRLWLRSTLKNLDFKILHHSTWIGENKIPKELIKEIYRLKMDDYVKVFSVKEKGLID